MASGRATAQMIKGTVESARTLFGGKASLAADVKKMEHNKPAADPDSFKTSFFLLTRRQNPR